ncbi:MAG TPA: hypothetical protein VFO10_14615 [Oligoflexus sp.]|uniref:hypothetical protein n=1 Tax=Oligoflexus sp. TaxID=1971216 RepID=UPI002D7F1030|nr:hypothetical protein [Oligoflexus sp.]HET9238490.1 hypothetical protein [Oligoflexus sp.]
MAGKRRTVSKRKNQKIPNEYILVGVVGVVAAFFVYRSHGTEPTHMAAEAPVHSSEKGTQVQVLASNQPTVDVKKYQEDLNRERAQFARARELGLKSLPLKNQGDTITIPLSFVPEKVWCQGGDLDTMKYASRNEQAKDFIITLEGIDRGGKNPFMRTSLDELQKGLNASFTIPRPKEATSYGVYICSDSRKDNSCQRKGMLSHAKLSEQLAENPERARGEDRVFFFQNLVIDGKTVEAYRTDDLSNEFQRTITGHLTKKGLSASDVQKAIKTNLTLKSAPADIRKDRIVFSLPYNDPRCIQPKGR